MKIAAWHRKEQIPTQNKPTFMVQKPFTDFGIIFKLDNPSQSVGSRSRIWNMTWEWFRVIFCQMVARAVLNKQFHEIFQEVCFRRRAKWCQKYRLIFEKKRRWSSKPFGGTPCTAAPSILQLCLGSSCGRRRDGRSAAPRHTSASDQGASGTATTYERCKWRAPST